MKKIITLLVMAICLVTIESNAQLPIIILKHGDNATFFEYDKLEDAVSASVDGDSIILSEGTFNGGITINKKLSIIGSGQKSIINGDVTFKMAGEQTLTSRLLDGVKISGNLTISSDLINLSLRKVSMLNLKTNKVRDAYLDRCNILNFLYGNDELHGHLINSLINKIYYAAKNINFINCYINSINYGSYNHCNNNFNFSGKVLNSILKDIYGQNYNLIDSSCSLTNSIVNSQIDITEGIIENCYILSTSEIDGLNRMDIESLISIGYIGVDGTAVGEYGGLTPYTLEPKGPRITNMELKVDPENNQLKVTATGTAN